MINIYNSREDEKIHYEEYQILADVLQKQIHRISRTKDKRPKFELQWKFTNVESFRKN